MYLSVKVAFESANKYLLFLLFIGVAVLLYLASEQIIITEDLIFDFYGQQLTYERITDLIEKSNKWRWIVYVAIPVYYLIKFLIISICLYTGVFLAGYSINFTKLFHVVMFSEFIFLIVPVVKIVWFGIFLTDYTLQDLQYFSPLSLLSLVDRNSIEPWLAYPLQLVNVFEISYWLLLALGLCSLTKERYSKMLGLVASSYGVGLLLWVVFIVFLSVSISPT